MARKKPTKRIRNEGGVKAWIRYMLDALEAWYYMPVQSGYGKAGIPDFIVCINGRFLSIETKYGHNKPTKNQVTCLNDIIDANGIALVINEKNLRLAWDVLIYLRGLPEDAHTTECPGGTIKLEEQGTCVKVHTEGKTVS